MLKPKSIKAIRRAIDSSTSSREKRKYLFNRLMQILKEDNCYDAEKFDK